MWAVCLPVAVVTGLAVVIRVHRSDAAAVDARQRVERPVARILVESIDVGDDLIQRDAVVGALESKKLLRLPVIRCRNQFSFFIEELGGHAMQADVEIDVERERLVQDVIARCRFEIVRIANKRNQITLNHWMIAVLNQSVDVVDSHDLHLLDGDSLLITGIAAVEVGVLRQQ